MSAEDCLLTPENLRRRLASRGLVRDPEALAIRELGGGVSNLVFSIEGPGVRWVAKQSLDKLRVADDWRSDRNRIFREAEAIAALRKALGQDSVPQVVDVDRENYFFVMTAAPPASVVWKESLLAGEVDPDIARAAARDLARIILASHADAALRRRFEDRSVFDQLRLDPYYRTAAARHPDVASALTDLVRDTLEVQTALVHGDYSPKNMLVCGKKIFLIDFEVAHWGDPAFDAAFLLNHLLLKSFHRPAFARLYLAAAEDFWKTLLEGLGSSRDARFEPMTTRHLGGLMLARIDGKSPVEYIRDEPTRQLVRRVAKRILLKRPETVREALEMVS